MIKNLFISREEREYNRFLGFWRSLPESETETRDGVVVTIARSGFPGIYLLSSNVGVKVMVNCGNLSTVDEHEQNQKFVFKIFKAIWRQKSDCLKLINDSRGEWKGTLTINNVDIHGNMYINKKSEVELEMKVVK